MRIQTCPNVIASENRICLTRIRWERGVVGKGGYTAKLSVSLCFDWRSLWVGLSVKQRCHGFYAWLCLLPCLPIRVSFQRSYGGIFP